MQAFQNAQLWKLIERERQKNAELRTERDEARRRSAFLESQASFFQDIRPDAQRLDQSVNSIPRPLAAREFERANSDDEKAERQRANTVTETGDANIPRPPQPVRYYSDQQQQQPPQDSPQTLDSDRIMGEHNPFMLKMPVPRPFVESQPSSPVPVIASRSGYLTKRGKNFGG